MKYKDIPNYEGIYQVNEFGDVKSCSRLMDGRVGNKSLLKERILKPQNDAYGYKFVRLYKDKKAKNWTIHQLVAIVFLNHTPNGIHGLVVDHIDCNKHNNHYSNLQLITQRENTKRVVIKNKTSKYKGVSWSKTSRKWVATITVNKKRLHLGYHKCELAAAKAYNNKLKTLQDEY